MFLPLDIPRRQSPQLWSAFPSAPPGIMRRAPRCHLSEWCPVPSVFMSWLHPGSFSGCFEPQITAPQAPPGSSLPPPSGWSSPRCSLRSGRWTKRSQRSEWTKVTPGTLDVHPGHPPPFGKTPQPHNWDVSRSPVLRSDVVGDGLRLSAAPENQDMRV